MYLISACLAGVNCRYNGGNNERSWVKEFMEGKDCMLVCPEVLGELPTPRPPSEQVSGRVMDNEGRDVTEHFLKGALKTMRDAEKKAAGLGQKIDLAILKANSPSCGSGKIYDGTFSKILTDGDGIFAAMLKEGGIPVINENQREEAENIEKKTYQNRRIDS